MEGSAFSPQVEHLASSASGQRKIISREFCHLEGSRPAAIGQAWHCGHATSRRSMAGILLSILKPCRKNATGDDGSRSTYQLVSTLELFGSVP
jgi:hypothetical protein